MRIVFMNGYYEGDVDIFGRRCGYGVVIMNNGDRYEGEWRKDMKHGKGKYTCSTGTCYEGEWRHDLLHGKGKTTCPKEGWCYEGEFRAGIRNGQGKMIWTEGPHAGSYLEGEFRNNDIWKGKGRMKYDEKSIYEGEFRKGKKCGCGKMLWPRESYYEGTFMDDKPVRGKIYKVTYRGEIFEGELIDGFDCYQGKRHTPMGHTWWECGKTRSSMGKYTQGFRVEKFMKKKFVTGRWLYEKQRLHLTSRTPPMINLWTARCGRILIEKSTKANNVMEKRMAMGK